MVRVSEKNGVKDQPQQRMGKSIKVCLKGELGANSYKIMKCVSKLWTDEYLEFNDIYQPIQCSQICSKFLILAQR